MSTISVSNVVSAPLDEVFKAFTDLDRVAHIVRSIKNVDVLTPGGFRLGTRWSETREVLGQHDSAEMEVTSFEHNRAYTVTHHKAGARVDTRFSFEPVDSDKTTVTIALSLEQPGLPPGLLAPVTWAIGGRIRETLVRDLLDVKQAVEARPRGVAADR